MHASFPWAFVLAIVEMNQEFVGFPYLLLVRFNKGWIGCCSIASLLLLGIAGLLLFDANASLLLWIN